jgi:hypothetical protein
MSSSSNWTAAAGFGSLRVGRLDLPENLPLGAQQDDAPAPAHPLGEL